MQRRAWDKRTDVVLSLCGIQVFLLLSAVFAYNIIGRHSSLLTRIDAVGWLVCGLTSIGLSLFDFLKAPNRRWAMLMVLLSMAVFFLCGFQFFLV